MLRGILWGLWMGAPWSALPARYGSQSTIHRRLSQWTVDETLLNLWRGFLYTEAPFKRVELYNLSDDPHEQHNIAPQQPRLTYDLEQTLFTIVRHAQTHAHVFGISTADEHESRQQP